MTGFISLVRIVTKYVVFATRVTIPTYSTIYVGAILAWLVGSIVKSP